jgi:diacylglycerol kinase
MTRISFLDSSFCAFKGLFHGISSERNIKIQIAIGGLTILTAILLGISKISLITIIIVCFLVVILELFNRGFEKLIDLVSPEYNKEFGKVKDAMAGVVLLTFGMAIIVSLLILYEPIINFINSLSQNPGSILFVIIDVLLLGTVILIEHFKKNKKINQTKSLHQQQSPVFYQQLMG